MEKNKSKKKDDKTILVIVGIIALIIIFVIVRQNYCSEIVPKQVEEKYTDQEPYTVYESRTSTKTIARDNCDYDSGCVCTGRYLGILKSGCKECSCDITTQVPVTKYRNVEKTRIVTKDVKRC